MLWIFGVLSIFMLIEGWITFWNVIRFKQFFVRELRRKYNGPFPKVALLAPCKGLDPGMVENIQSWFDLDYPDFQIFFILDSEQDPARVVIENFRGANVMIAGTTADCGQKVHNLRFAIGRVPADFEVFAFVDSDCRLKPDWLRNLVRKVVNDPNQAATGYRWFTKGGNFGSVLRAAWNSGVLTLYKENGKDNFAWGGSTAILRKTFESARVLEYWKGSISDDYSLTRALKASGRRVDFVPGSLAFTTDSITLPQFLGWVFRQLLITRIYYPKLWFAVFLFHCAWFIWILIGLMFPVYFVPIFALVQLLHMLKADLRWQCIRETGETSIGQRISLWLCGPVVSACNFLLTLSTIVTRKITWRNVEYTLHSPNQLFVHQR